LFSFLPNHDVSENTELKYTPVIAHNNQIKKDTIHVAVLFPDLRENTYENRLKNIALGYFEQYLSNELLNTVRFEKGLVYDITTDTFGNEKTGLDAIVTQTTPERIAEVVAAISRTCFHVYQEKHISEQELQRYKNFDKLPMADFLENAKGRAKRITNFWHHYNRLYDFDKSKAETNSITVQNIIDASRGYFDGPMSIITQGADFDADLKQIWENNFKGDM
jgi:predicted Zn-dependent peptidase